MILPFLIEVFSFYFITLYSFYHMTQVLSKMLSFLHYLYHVVSCNFTIKSFLYSRNNHIRSVMPSLLQTYYLICGSTAGFSSILYIFSPSGTIKYFGGIPSSSNQLWTQLTSAGDLLISYLCYVGYKNSKSSNTELQSIIIRGMTVYSLFHFGLFLNHHLRVQKHPHGGLFLYAGSLACALGALFKWGNVL